jgi:hypothetical protein
MPIIHEDQRIVWLNTHVNIDRLEKRIIANLVGRSLIKAQKLVNAVTDG